MTYLGNDLQVAYPTYRNIDDISGSFNGSTTSFALLVGGVAPVPLPLNSQQCLISVAGVVLRPDDTGTEGFRLSGGNIIFKSAPSSGADFFGVILAGADYINVGVNFPSGSASVPSITFDSDLDTGIFNPSQNNIAIVTGGTQRLIIDASGRLGLGTSSPATRFDVVSTASASTAISRFKSGTAAGDRGVEIASDSNSNVLIQAIRASDNTTGYQLAINPNGGNVGIGTTTVSRPLVIFNDSVAALALQNTSAGTSASDGFQMQLVGSNGYIWNYENGASIFATNDTERARIDSSGRLLVGTSTALANGWGGSGQTQLASNSFSVGQIFSFTSAGADGYGSYFELCRARGTQASPSVVTSGDELGEINFYGHDGSSFIRGASIRSYVDGTPGANDMPGRLVFSTTADGASSPTERMRIASNGLVSTESNLQCKGRLYWSGGADGSSLSTSSIGAATTTVYIGNAAIQVSSDVRLKENIANTVVDAAEELKKVRVVDFTWNDPTDSSFNNRNARGVWTGLIAQELVEVFPFAVNAPRKEEDLSIDYDDEAIWTVDQNQLVPVLIKAFQQQQERIETLEAKVAALQAS